MHYGDERKEMKASTVNTKPPPQRGPSRAGRPPRELAGEVEERILDAAGAVFLERGFAGASIDEIASVARAGKPAIYARFPNKEALFTAVIARMVRQNTMTGVAATGSTLEERLAQLAAAILRAGLAPNSVELIRSAVAEARRFPKLANNVGRMARERASEAVARSLGELDETPPLPAFAPDRLAATASQFLDLVLLPLLIRALFGEDPVTLHAEIGPHVARSVAFFLAACRHGGED